MAERTPSPRIEPQASSKGTRRGKDAVEIKLEMLDGSEVTVNDVDVSLKGRKTLGFCMFTPFQLDDPPLKNTLFCFENLKQPFSKQPQGSFVDTVLKSLATGHC